MSKPKQPEPEKTLDPKRHPNFWLTLTHFATYATILGVVICWGYFAKEGIQAVIGLYDRGFGTASAIFIYAVLPVIALALSLIIPLWYMQRKKAGVALAAAVLSILIWLAYFVVFVTFTL